VALERLREVLAQALFGQEEVIEALLATVLARGHALLEGVPGLGKTLLAESFARASGLSYKRIQFTPRPPPSGPDGERGLPRGAL
jgi:MoxR-like ATPase